MADDVMFIIFRGRIKSAKHICLGLGLKSLTSSRHIVEILNHFGHCIDYNTADSLETDLATSITDRQQATPDGIQQQPGLCTSLAWDNYDDADDD